MSNTFEYCLDRNSSGKSYLFERRVLIVALLAIPNVYKLALAGVGSLVVGSALAISPTLCRMEEKTVFSCQTGKKFASLCASHGRETSKDSLRYVFGKPKAIELSIPSKTVLPATQFHNGSTSYSLGSMHYVRFVNGQYEYIIYSNQGQTKMDASKSLVQRGWLQEGVLVAKNTAMLANFPCRKFKHPVSAFRENIEYKNIKLPIVQDAEDIERVENLLSVDLDKPYSNILDK